MNGSRRDAEGTYGVRGAVRLWVSPVLGALVASTCVLLPVFLTSALAVQITESLEVDASSLGGAVAAFFGASSVGSMLLGRLADRFGGIRMMRIGSALTGAVLMGIALADHWNALVGLLVVGGIANGAVQPAANQFVARKVVAGKHGAAFGVKQASYPAAVLISGLTVPTIGLTVGWRWAFAGSAIALVLFAIVVPTVVARRAQAETPVAKRDERAALSGSVQRASTRTFLVVMSIGTMLGLAAANTLGAFFVVSSVAYGVSQAFAGLLAAIGGLSSLVTRVVIGVWSDRQSVEQLPVIVCLVGLGALGFLLLATGQPWILAPAAIIAFGAGWGWTGLMNHAMVRVRPEDPGHATGIIQAGAAVGGVVGPFSFGFLAEHASYPLAWLATSGTAVVAVITLTAGWRLLGQRPCGGANIVG